MRGGGLRRLVAAAARAREDDLPHAALPVERDRVVDALAEDGRRLARPDRRAEHDRRVGAHVFPLVAVGVDAAREVARKECDRAERNGQHSGDTASQEGLDS